jgi:hypothetical protein
VGERLRRARVSGILNRLPLGIVEFGGDGQPGVLGDAEDVGCQSGAQGG